MLRLIGAIALVAIAGACAQQSAPTREDLVARGEYLVNAVAGCNDCHTPMTPQGPEMSKALQGATLSFGPLVDGPWAPIAPPIAGIPAHYTEAQLVAFLQTGVRPDGSHPLPPMPPYRLSEDDARAVAAYIATLPRAQ